MNTIQRIAKNTGMLIVSKLVNYLLTFFFIMCVARYLGVRDFGIFSFAIAYTGIFAFFVDLGLNTLMTREVARNKSLANKYFRSIIIMKCILSFITFGLILLIINLLDYSKQTIEVVAIIALSVIIDSFSKTFYSIFQAHEQMQYQSLGQVLSVSLKLASALGAIALGFSIVGFAFLYLIASISVLIYSFMICSMRFIKPRLEIDLSFLQQSIKKSWPMGAMAICVMIYFRIDTIMLSLMKGQMAVGLYSAAYRLSEISTVIPAMFVASLFPVLSKYHRDYTGLFIKTFERSIKYLLYIALPMALTVTLLSRPIISMIYGQEFSGSIVSLQILIWAAAIMYVTILLGTTFVTADKQMLNLKFTIIAVALNIILNLIIIPRYSYVGASATTVITEVFGLFAGILLLGRHGYKLNIIKICLPLFYGLLTFGASLIILFHLGVNIFVVVILAIVAYGVTIYKTGIKEDDKKLIKSLLNFSRNKDF